MVAHISYKVIIFNKYPSATAPFALLFSVPLPDLHALIISVVILPATLAALGLVDRILFISYPNTTLIIAEVVDTSVDVIVDHLTCLKECLLHIECCFGGCLQEDEAIFLGKALTFLCAHLAPVVQVGLVAD